MCLQVVNIYLLLLLLLYLLQVSDVLVLLIHLVVYCLIEFNSTVYLIVVVKVIVCSIVDHFNLIIIPLFICISIIRAYTYYIL